MKDYPQFAVVGNPNKGKSSIVSSLAQDDSVSISDTPGTTTQSRSFPLRLDGEIIYELIDTPGFQRARQVLAWLQSQDVPAHQRAEAVRAFIRIHQKDARFHDEIELLRPIMEGAGIIYVVDGSKPYGQEYEAQMEILRWTGQPSMALINHITKQDYSDAWRRALEQYFRIVRQYNPMETDFLQQRYLLEAMAQLKEAWRAPLANAVALFEKQHQERLMQSAKMITRLIETMLSYTLRYPLQTADATQEDRDAALKQYQSDLRTLEQKAQKRIEILWQHHSLQKEQALLELEEMDLFSKESASVFGLSREEILVMGVTGGVVAGAGVDLFFAGHTLLLGGAIGAVAGGIGAYMGFDELSEIKIFGKTLGNSYLEVGPMKNRNFPYIVLGRALYHLHIVATHSHANRKSVSLRREEGFRTEWLGNESKKYLEKLHKKWRTKQKSHEKERVLYEEEILRYIQRIVT